MPILEVSALPQKQDVDIPAALKEASLAIAKVYGCDPKHVWATWHRLEAGHYVEGDRAASVQPADTHPPIVRLTCFEGKSAAEIEAVLLVASTTLSRALGIEGNVFITYVEAKSGQVVAGNGIIRR